MKRFTEKEKKFIKENHGKITNRQILNFLPGHTINSLNHFLYSNHVSHDARHHLKEWQMKFILENHETMNRTELKNKLGCSFAAVKRFFLDKGITPCYIYKKYKCREREEVYVPIVRPPAIYSNPCYATA